MATSIFPPSTKHGKSLSGQTSRHKSRSEALQPPSNTSFIQEATWEGRTNSGPRGHLEMRNLRKRRTTGNHRRKIFLVTTIIMLNHSLWYPDYPPKKTFLQWGLGKFELFINTKRRCLLGGSVRFKDNYGITDIGNWNRDRQFVWSRGVAC